MPEYTLRFAVQVTAADPSGLPTEEMIAALKAFPDVKDVWSKEPYEHQLAEHPGRPAESRDAAERWLRMFLTMRIEPVPARLVIDAAEKAGISHRTLRRAADKLGVVRFPRGGTKVTWSLPRMEEADVSHPEAGNAADSVVHA